MDRELLDKIIEWDQVNWGKAIPFWEDRLRITKGRALELGGRKGGLSLWLAKKGFNVVCSDLENPERTAYELHKDFPDLKISYEAINALNIPYEDQFDVIIFKSILGGIARNGKDEIKKEVIQQIHKALKKGGVLLFAENLEASGIHRFFRKNFVKWGAEWNYLRATEIEELFSSFSKLEYRSKGFFGAFGRNESQRKLLGKIDGKVDPFLGSKQHYLVFGVATK